MNVKSVLVGNSIVIVLLSLPMSVSLFPVVTVFAQENQQYSFVTKWGSEGIGNGKFTQPIDIAIDSSGNLYVTDLSNVSNKIQKFSWLEDIRKNPSAKFIREPHYDDWLDDKHVQVFSYVKMIQDKGSEVGYVEIQQREDKLKQICDVKNDDNVMIAVINEKGKVIYSSWKLLNNVLIKHYRNIAKDKEKQTVVKNNPFSELAEIVSYQYSDYTGWTVFMIESKEKLFVPLQSIRNTMILVIFGIIVLSVKVLYIFSERLTSPLRRLKEEMEKINVDNLPDDLQIKQITDNDTNEIDALNSSFIRMRERLNQAMKTEIRSRSLQLKAHFDALQSQINPHFLYNILGVIPNMGDEDDILDACIRLADMLRYSTSNIQVRTTIKDEITHVTNYLILMKKRFEHRLEYIIEVDEDLLEVAIPKLVIQPLVENSISHGFDNSNQPIMKISIKVEALENEWSVSITDNGSGFEKGALEELQLRFKHYASCLLSNEDIEALKIGGMGLTNTFARLFLFYGQRLKFELKNNETEGASINIRGSLSEYEQIGGYKNV